MESGGTPSPLGFLQTPYSTRLLTSGCCPDKDLVVLISRLGGRDRLSLWNYIHGSKVWEVDAGNEDENASADIAGLAWSPDGKTIAVILNPPQFTLHSLQDGTKQLTLPIPSNSDSHIDGIWWFHDETAVSAGLIPDIFKRNEVIPGTAHAIFRMLPLLDSLPEDSQRLTLVQSMCLCSLCKFTSLDDSATDLFAFQGSQTRAGSRLQLPPVISEWPTLAPNSFGDLFMASTLGSSPVDGTNGSSDETNMKSISIVSDSQGYLYPFLNGSFPMGSIFLGIELSVKSLFMDPKRSFIAAQPVLRIGEPKISISALQPVIIDFPVLSKRYPHDLAKLASTARELVWYIIRVIAEMHTTWFGSETFAGARELGPKWIDAIETKQKEQFGQDEPNAILDLTTLLVTGRATDSLLDFLGSGDQMSERGIQKWESTMTEALVKLRDFAEKRIAPACQRLHLVLEELHGWSKMPHFAFFRLPPTEIHECIEFVSSMVVLAGWLATTVRRDLSQFREFIHWIRFEMSAANPANETAPQPRHDILEVNNYLISGLPSSTIDDWFTGPRPGFSLNELDGTLVDGPLSSVLERARVLSQNSSQLSSRPSLRGGPGPSSKNLKALVDELAIRCKQVFEHAAKAVSRSATISSNLGSAAGPISRVKANDPVKPFSVREKIVKLHETGELLQYLVLPVSLEETRLLCIARLRYNNEALESAPEAGVVLLEPFVFVGDEEMPNSLDMLEVDFMDDERIVIIYRMRDIDEPTTYIATTYFNDLDYQSIQGGSHVSVLTREDLILEAIEQWKQGRLSSIRLSLKQCHALKGCKTGDVSLALNGRQGRKVACVLDAKGTALESFDLEGDADDIEN